jgi:hypothetical protein
MNAAAAAVELHLAVDEGKERVVASLADPLAGVEYCAHLADEDVSGANLFAAKPLHPATLGIAVASVPAGTLSLFMCHEITLLTANLSF